jgi:hypothetical protein
MEASLWTSQLTKVILMRIPMWMTQPKAKLDSNKKRSGSDLPERFFI